MMNNRKDYLVHDEGEIGKIGDVVRIESCRPVSKRKHFALAEILQKTKLEPVTKNEEEKRKQRMAAEEVEQEKILASKTA
jgi:small subunit ribosomal protein S17